MSDPIIRRVQGDEMVEISQELAGYAFRASPPLPLRETWGKDLVYYDPQIFLALFEGEKGVSTAVCSPMTQQVRGQIYRVGGIWGVATHPAARRKGYSRQVLVRLFEEARKEGMALLCLYPFRESFYERLGFVTFPRARKVRFSPRDLTTLFKSNLEGEVELMPVAEGFQLYREYLLEQQQLIHGLALFGDKPYQRLREQNAFWLAVAQVQDRVAGVMLYQLKGEMEDMLVPRFYYNNSQGLYLLLEWFARHADQAGEVELKLPPYELPETWLADLNPKISSFEPPMGRVVEITRLDGMQTGPGKFSACISDPYCPWNVGCFRFETVDGKLRVITSESADCNLSIQGLSALVYGTHAPDSFAIRGWGNPSEQVQTAMNFMFPRKLPYLHEVF